MVMSYLAGDKELGVKRGDGLDCLAALEWCCLEGNACWSGGTGREHLATLRHDGSAA